ncbi:MAG TPA: hypothetical protein VFX76_12605, partial [Roseiflexaceae bacterium]|nr:hypothetical protein [Roseiflexaceae bacterium]
MSGVGMLSTLSQPWLIAVLGILAVGLLEGERWWTRWSRSRGQHAHVAAYVLDGLAVTSALLMVLALLVLLVRLFVEIFALLGELISLASGGLLSGPWALVVVVAVLVAIGIGIMAIRSKARAPRREPAPRAVSAQRAALARGKSGGFFDTLAAEEAPEAVITPQAPTAPNVQPQMAAQPTPQIVASSTPSFSAGARSTPVEGLASISMMGQRRVHNAAPIPSSFIEPVPVVTQRRSKMPFALLFLIVVAASGFFFREQLLAFLPNIWATTSAAISRAGDIVQPTVSAVASPVPAVAASPATAPTPLSQASRQVASDELNLRAGPGTDQDVLATLR